MEKVVSAEEMRWCDTTAINRFGIPGMILMENAGKGVVECMVQRFPQLTKSHILVVCGKGNNGGDGFVIARHLLNKCPYISVVMMVSPAHLTGDTLLNYQILRKVQKANPQELVIQRYHHTILRTLRSPDIFVDAIFGTGFSGSVKAPTDAMIRWMNAQSCPVVSVDIPSGVHGTSGIVENIAVRATMTVTMGLMKTGLLSNQGRDHTGAIQVIDIGIPKTVTGSPKLRTEFVRGNDIHSVLPVRPSTAHKYSVGKVLVLAGAKGYTGAPALCANAALRSGAGAVILGTPEPIYPILARKLTETITLPLPSTSDGSLALEAWDLVSEKLSWADVLVIGPGLSRHEATQQLVHRIISSWNGRMVVDADALFALATLGKKKLKELKGELILTPHSGEFSKFIDRSSKEIEIDRIETCREFAQSTKTTLVLKGAPTVTGTPDGMIYMNSTGNPGMATVGSGDVLAGIIGSLWAQGMERNQAAYAGVFLHGLAGDCAKVRFGERSIVAQDLIDFLPEAVTSVEFGETV
ncbi:MAG: NAD(P)H-hydrate dehydratase [bacterium]